MIAVLVALGSNLGDRRETIGRGLELLCAQGGAHGLISSRLWSTRPIGGPIGQAEFLNAAATFSTSLSPQALLKRLQEIEVALGRVRDQRWGSRSLDLDLLLYGDLALTSSDLVVPHPRMAYRRFVLEPAADVASDWMHPVLGWTIGQLRDHLRNAPSYVAITGPPGAGKSALAATVAAQTGALLLPDPAAAVDLSGPATTTEIEFLRLRAKQLARQSLSTCVEGGRLAISDYWIHQGLAYAELRLSPSQRTEYHRVWETHVDLVPPKLLMLLDAPPATPSPDHEADPLRQAILAEARRPEQGPRIEFPGTVPIFVSAKMGLSPYDAPGFPTTAATAELVAAIGAMQDNSLAPVP